MSKIFLLKKDICLEHLKRFGYSESKICIYPKAMSKKISNYEEIRIYYDERNIPPGAPRLGGSPGYTSLAVPLLPETLCPR